MNFDLGPTSEDYKQQARALISAELTPERVAQVHDTGTFHHWEFHRALAARGWLAPGWPVEYGGRGLDPLEVLAFQEELADAGAPTYGVTTTMMIAGVVRELGTAQQKADILPRALRGEILIALGFTEPECGSDVAAAATRAVRDGSGWRITGAKMFTTNAHVADYVFLLARSDPQVPKHKGLTTFLVPLNGPGVTIQPVMTMSGERTNATFYDDVYIDDDARIGEVNEGWGTMTVALTLERANAGGGDHRRLVAAAESWAAGATNADGTALIDDPSVAARLARAATEAEVTKLLGYRSVWMSATGQVPGVEGSMAKLFSSESLVRMSDDLATLTPEGLRADDSGHREIERAIRHAQPTTIYGGTSEVQRSIIAQRGLGLPRPS